MTQEQLDMLEERFRRFVVIDDETKCWLWLGAQARNGYGYLPIVQKGQRKRFSAHRLSWLLFRGPLEDGKCVCHRCNNKECCSPEHLYLGTHIENIRDALRDGLMTGPKKKKFCRNGHPYSGDNIAISFTKRGMRRACRICLREADRRFKCNRRVNPTP